MSFICPLLFTLLATCLCDDVDRSKSILVLVENTWIKETHTRFLKLFTDRGYNLTVRLADDASNTLMQYGEYTHGHLVLLSPSVSEFGGTLDAKNIVKFLDDGGNLVVAASSEVGEAVRTLGSECGIEFDDEKAAVIDHHNYDIKDDGTHTLIVVSPDNLLNVSVVTGESGHAPFLYRGVGMSANTANPLLISILHAGPTSYSYNPVKPVSDYPNTVGNNTQLIVALQARNNARSLFIGSLDFLSDDFLTNSVEKFDSTLRSSTSGNLNLLQSLIPWVLGERGQLRVVSVEHHRKGESIPPNQYTIMDDVHYSIGIETKNELNQWIPYEADDVQLEFVRIDPFIRRTMKYRDGRHSTELRLPDVYGVFKFVVDYHRLGYTHLKSVTQVPVRPFTHTQYERFIEAAYPYYFSAISMLVGVVVFSFVFLYYKDDKEKAE